MNGKLMFALACGLALTAAPAQADDEQKITFDEHIKPIFREHCASCHSQSDKQSDLALDTYAAALAGGSSGEVIADGNSGGSRLFALVTHAEQPHMPPDAQPIPEPQRALIKSWIDQGMPENSGSTIKRKNNAAAAMLTSSSTGKPDGPPAMPEKVLRQPVVLTQRSAAIAAMAASPWAPLVAVGGQQQVTLYNTQTSELVGIIPFPEGEPQSLTFTRDGKQLLIGGGRHSHSGCAVLVDVATGDRISKVGDELDTVLAADISADKKRIAIGGPQKLVRIFDTFTGDLIVEMKKHTDWIFALRFSPDGVLLASGDRSNGLVVWEAQTGLLYMDCVGHKGSIRGVDFRPDSNVLASASMDGNLKLWDMPESKEVKSWVAHGGGATAVVFAQNGMLASTGMDLRVKLWNGEGAVQKEFAGLGEQALEVAVTGDATQVVGGDWTGKIQLWQVADANQTVILAANPPSIEQRLAAAQTSLVTFENEFNAVKQSTDASLAEAVAAQSQLTAAQQAASDLTNKLAEATNAQAAVAVQVTALDKQAAELEMQLALVRQQRAQMGSQLEQANVAVAQFTQSAKEAQDAMAAALAKEQAMAKAAELARVKQAEIDAKLAAARIVTERAHADKVALEAAAVKVQTESAASLVKLQQLADQAAVALAQRQAQQESATKVAADLKSLQDQLAALQKNLESAVTAQSTAQQQLAEQEKKAADLKAAQEAAEQEAADAKEKLELFQKAYAAPK